MAPLMGRNTPLLEYNALDCSLIGLLHDLGVGHDKPVPGTSPTQPSFSKPIVVSQFVLDSQAMFRRTVVGRAAFGRDASRGTGRTAAKVELLYAVLQTHSCFPHGELQG